MLERSDTKVVAGRVKVTGEGTYEATLQAITFDRNALSARYDIPDEPDLEMAMTATFDGASVKGTWKASAKADGTEAASCTWTATKR